MPRYLRTLVAACALVSLQLSVPNTAQAQDEETDDSAPQVETREPDLQVAADRPGASDGSAITPIGHVQVETGFQMTFAPGGQTYDLAGTLGRIGLTDYLEARLSASPVTISSPRSGETTAEPLSTLQLGAKIGGALSDEVAVAIRPFGNLQAPTGSTTWEAGANGIVDLGTDSKVGMTLNLAFSSAENGSGKRGLATFAAVTASGSLPGKGGIYFELFGNVPPDRVPRLFFDTGLTYLVTPRVQLDAFIGIDVTEATERFVGLGAAFLI